MVNRAAEGEGVGGPHRVGLWDDAEDVLSLKGSFPEFDFSSEVLPNFNSKEKKSLDMSISCSSKQCISRCSHLTGANPPACLDARAICPQGSSRCSSHMSMPALLQDT